jgi:ATP/maltotriose-dependent transcriptional regulator MalT
VAARRAGASGTASRLLDDAAKVAGESRLRAEIDCERGRRSLYHGRAGDAYRLIEQAACRMRHYDPQRAAGMLGVAAFSALIAGSFTRSIALAREAQELVKTQPDTAEQIIDLTLGTALFHVGDVEESYSVLLAAAESVERSPNVVDPEYVGFAALALTWVGEYTRARALLMPILENARVSSAFGVLCVALHASSYLEARTGHLTSAYAVAVEALATAETISNDLWRYFSLGCLAYTEAAQGREKDCRRHAADALVLARQLDIAYPATVLDALGLLELALGRPDHAIQHLEIANRRGPQGEITMGRPTSSDLFEAYVRAGRSVPDSLLREVITISHNEHFPAVAAFSWRCRGLLAEANEIDKYFEVALSLHRQTDNPFALARTQLCYGERLRRAGRQIDARNHLHVARDLFEMLGAVQWIVRVDTELRAAGGRRPRKNNTGINTLTPQELQVAFSVARGMTNREAASELYLSPKTVEFHLSQIYRKLGIRSRSELASLVVRQQSTLGPTHTIDS